MKPLASTYIQLHVETCGSEPLASPLRATFPTLLLYDVLRQLWPPLALPVRAPAADVFLPLGVATLQSRIATRVSELQARQDGVAGQGVPLQVLSLRVCVARVYALAPQRYAAARAAQP